MNTKHFFIFPLLIFIFLITLSTISSAEVIYTPMSCEEKLKFLEPSIPRTIYDYELLRDRDINEFKEKTSPISLIRKKGSNIKYETVYKNLNWKRPVYTPIWHSSSWRWSYVPYNMAYQRHIVYDYYGGGSWWFDLSNYLALPSDAGGPSPINKYAFTTGYPYVVRLIIFNFNISSMKYYKNQFCVFGEPLRTGLTIIDFDEKNLPNTQKLLQLATPDGYEIDFLILY